MRCSCRGSASVHAESTQEAIAVFVQGSCNVHGPCTIGFVRMTVMIVAVGGE